MTPAASVKSKYVDPAGGLRERLGIPSDARRVLAFVESSHWDTNWLSTSNEYFEKRVAPILLKVVGALESDPGRVYCVESVFFLRLFWERYPHWRDRLRALFDGRRLRLLSSALTTPDTLLPPPEAILRDFHLGQQWLRAVGLSMFPRTAYFPDNFGHSPHLPSLMRAVGVDAVALTRIDGMYFVAADFRKRTSFPLRGSTAETLQKQLKTLDFIWRDDDGAEVLCHWHAFTYFQGDMLAHAGIVRWNGHVAAIPWRTRRHIARRIDGFVRQLEPLARTPILLCPIGMDFNDPIERLPELLARYNRERYPTTGTWAVLVGLDDYFALIGEHRDKLPTLAIDPNPYWMGFYSSRPEMKQRPARIARSLLLAEGISATNPPDNSLEAALHDGWAKLVLLNHHDAITGTSPDRVWRAEQRGWLDLAEAAATRALVLARHGQTAAGEDPSPCAGQSPRIFHQGCELHVSCGHHRLVFSKDRGGCLVSLLADGKEQLRGLGLDLVAYGDEGGLWRLGHEYQGGRFQPVERASRKPAKLSVREVPGGVTVTITSELRGSVFRRIVTLGAVDPFIHLHVEGFASRRLTVTCRFELALSSACVLEMDTVGGSIRRPHRRIHEPTFWPVPSLVSLLADSGVHVSFEAPTAVSYRAEDSALEWIVARNAPKERAFGLLPVLAHPIGGTVDELQAHRAALFVTPSGDIPSEWTRALELTWLAPELRPLRDRMNDILRCDQDAVSVVVSKRADAGPGVIVRLAAALGCTQTVRLRAPRAIQSAARCDAREQDIGPLVVEEGCAVVPIESRLTTVRLVI